MEEEAGLMVPFVVKEDFFFRPLTFCLFYLPDQYNAVWKKIKITATFTSIYRLLNPETGKSTGQEAQGP